MRSGDSRTRTTLAEVVRSLALACATLPPFLVGLVIVRRGENVPFFDQWGASAPVALAAVRGQLSWGDLLAQHNEHRIVFTRALTALLAVTTRWNLRWEMFANAALALAVLLLVALLLRRQRVLVDGLVWLVLSALLFSPSQRWTWGFLSQWYFMGFFAVLGAVCLARIPMGWSGLAAAAVSALCATFSFGAGMVAWVALPVVMWGVGYRAPVHYAAWVTCAAVALVAYFTGYDFYYTDRSLGLSSLVFALVFLGGPFVATGGSLGLAVAVGLLGLGLLAANAWSLRARGTDTSALGVWLGIAAFGVGVALLVGGGRLVLGLPAALSARYVAPATLFWVAVAALGFVASRGGAGARGLRRANAGTLALLALLYVHAAVVSLSHPMPPTSRHTACVLAFPETRDAGCLRGLLPEGRIRPADDPEYTGMLRAIEGLAAERLALFAQRGRT